MLSILLWLSALSSDSFPEREAASQRLLWVAPFVADVECPEAQRRIEIARDRWRSAGHYARMFAVCASIEERWNIDAQAFAAVEDPEEVGLSPQDIDHAFGMWARMHKLESATNDQCERFCLWYRARNMDPPFMPYGP